MKNFILAIAIFLLLNFSATAQSCLPDGINFSSQEEIDDFQTNYPGCTVVEGDVFISGSGITNFDGLSVVEAFEGELYIFACSDLVSLSGLEAVESIGGNFKIDWNESLVDLTGLENLEIVGGNLEISVNDLLTSLNGLSSLTSISGGLMILDNIDLPDVSGLESLVSIGGDLNIQSNYILTTISAFESLTAIGNDILIYNNSLLQNLDGLNGVSSIGEDLTVTANESLADINGLSNLTSIGGVLKIDDNDALTSLNGLNHIAAESIAELHVIFNASLSTCHVKSVCDYLANPNGTLSIFANSIGCTDTQTILDQCGLSSGEYVFEKSFTLYPNPADQKLVLLIRDGSILKSVTVYNEIKQLFTIENPGNILDISDLSPGLYFIKLETNQWVFTEKLIVQ